MKACGKYKPMIEDMLGGQISREDWLDLERHARECGECRELLGIHEQLTANPSFSQPIAEAELKRVRATVLAVLQDRKKRQPGRSVRVAFAAPFWRPAGAVALSVLLLAIGFLSAKMWDRSRNNPAGFALDQMRALARQNRQITDIENSPYIFSNVSLHDSGQSQVDLGFDATLHVDASVAKTDPLVKEVLVQTLLNQSPLGNRLKAISFAKDFQSPEIKQALLSSMLHDPDLAVRLKSLTILSSYKRDPDVQSAFLQILKYEPSVQMRLLALDFIGQSDPGSLRKVIPELQSRNDTAVLVKASDYLR